MDVDPNYFEFRSHVLEIDDVMIASETDSMGNGSGCNACDFVNLEDSMRMLVGFTRPEMRSTRMFIMTTNDIVT
jgi:hypothetical protein